MNKRWWRGRGTGTGTGTEFEVVGVETKEMTETSGKFVRFVRGVWAVVAVEARKRKRKCWFDGEGGEGIARPESLARQMIS